MKAAQDIILKPVITEASMSGIADRSTPSRSPKMPTKIEIAAAVEALFAGTKVAKVNTMNCKGKAKRMGSPPGLPPRLEKGHRHPDR